MPSPPLPILFFAAAGALVAGGSGGGWYLWQRGQQEAAKRLQHEDAIAAKEALQDAIDLAGLRKKAQEAGLNPDEVVAGYERLRDKQVSPGQVLETLRHAPIAE